MISFHLKYAIKYRELQKKGGLLLDLICEFQTCAGVKLDLPCCAGVYILWKGILNCVTLHLVGYLLELEILTDCCW